MSTRGRRLRLGFVMDPLPAISIEKDTAFVFLLERAEREVLVYRRRVTRASALDALSELNR